MVFTKFADWGIVCFFCEASWDLAHFSSVDSSRSSSRKEYTNVDVQ